MGAEVTTRDKSNNSANLAMSKEFLVVKGKHFQVNKGYLYRANQTQAISVKDILSMEYLTMRSKRLLIVFMVLMTVVVFGGLGIRKLLSVTTQADREVQKVENVYNYVAEEDVNTNITGFIKNIFLELGIRGVIVLYVLLIMGSAGCFLLYWMKPYRVLYISSLGKIIAVERRFYDKAQLDNLVKTWRMQL